MAAMSGAGLGMAEELQGLRASPLLLYRNHTHKTPHYLTKKNNIYIIYIYLTNVKEKSRLCKSPLCLLVLRGHGERAAGGGLYLDVSMFSSLKLLQCSITLLGIQGTGLEDSREGCQPGCPELRKLGRPSCSGTPRWGSPCVASLGLRGVPQPMRWGAQ